MMVVVLGGDISRSSCWGDEPLTCSVGGNESTNSWSGSLEEVSVMSVSNRSIDWLVFCASTGGSGTGPISWVV